MKRQDWETCTMVAQPVAFDTTQVTSAANYSNPKPGDPCHPLAAGAHAPAIAFHPTQDPISSTDGTTHAMGTGSKGGCATVAVAFSAKDYGADAGEIAPTLRAMGHAGSHANGGGQVAVAVTGDVFHTLRAEGFDASEDGTGRGAGAVAIRTAQTGSNGWGINAEGTAYTLDSAQQAVQSGMAVRRLTPRECERLQGFPDDYTAIPWRGKPASECPDGPRYKALDNSWAVPCAAWIGRRITEALA